MISILEILKAHFVGKEITIFISKLASPKMYDASLTRTKYKPIKVICTDVIIIWRDFSDTGSYEDIPSYYLVWEGGQKCELEP